MKHSKSRQFFDKSQSLRSTQLKSNELCLSHPSPYGKDRFCTPNNTPTKSPHKSPKSSFTKTHTPTNTPIKNNSTTCFATPRKKSKLIISERHQLDAPDICNEHPTQLFSFQSSERFALALQQTVYLWESGNVSILTEASNRITCVQFCRNDIAVSYDGKIELWNLNSNTRIKQLPSHSGRCGAMTSHHSLIATGGSDGIIHISNLSFGTVKSINTKMGEIASLSYSPNGAYLASASVNGQISIWGDHRPHFFQHGTSMNYVTWLNDDILAVGDTTNNGEIKLFSMHHSLDITESSISTGGPLSGLIHSPKWGIFVSHLDSPTSFEIYDHCLKKIRKIDKGPVLCMSLTPDESELAICTLDEFVLTYSLKEGVPQTERKYKSISISCFIR